MELLVSPASLTDAIVVWSVSFPGLLSVFAAKAGVRSAVPDLSCSRVGVAVGGALVEKIGCRVRQKQHQLRASAAEAATVARSGGTAKGRQLEEGAGGTEMSNKNL